MRRRRLKRLWARLQELQRQAPGRDQLLLKLGAARKEAGRAYSLVKIRIPRKDEVVTPETFTFTLNRPKLRQVRRREGRYVLRTNLVNDDPAQLRAYYIQLSEVEQAFKELKGDLGLRPIFISAMIASRLISLSHSSPTACRSRSKRAYDPSRPG
jgi:hypothetical protein